MLKMTLKASWLNSTSRPFSGHNNVSPNSTNRYTLQFINSNFILSLTNMSWHCKLFDVSFFYDIFILYTHFFFSHPFDACTLFINGTGSQFSIRSWSLMWKKMFNLLMLHNVLTAIAQMCLKLVRLLNSSLELEDDRLWHYLFVNINFPGLTNLACFLLAD